jgi:nucleotide-binding universal stress UspA family protein
MTETDPAAHRIVVGVDGSDQSKRALRWARWLSSQQGGCIDAVIVWQAPVALELNWGDATGDCDPEAHAAKTLTATVDDVFGADRPRQLNLVVLEGNPAKKLIEHSKNAMTLVVGTRGRDGLASLLGSVSIRCVEHATCPVLVIRGDYLPMEG